VLLLFIFYGVSRYSYNLFHAIADGLSIIVAACAFLILWNSRHFKDNDYFMFVGIALVFFGLLDFVHLLGNKNMGIFPGFGNLGPTFYIASRYVFSISLLVAPLFIKRKLNIALAFSVYGVVTFLILLSVLYWKVFPACFVEGIGPTHFKVISDYITCLILAAAALYMLVNRPFFDPRVLRIMVYSIILSIATGLTFTLYTDPFGVTNMVGHAFQIVSFYLIYLAIVETTVTKPQEIVFRKLKVSEETLIEKVRELDRANSELQREVTERKQIEEQLRYSEERFIKAFRSNPAALAITNRDDGTIIDVNGSYERLLGYSRSELIGRKTTDFDIYLHPSARSEILQLLNETGEAHDRDLTLRRKDGQLVDTIAAFETIAVNGGTTILSSLTDVTDRKKVEKALEESEKQYRLLFAANPNPMYVFDEETFRFLAVNDAAVIHYGWSREEFLTMTVLDIRPPEDRRLALDTIYLYQGAHETAIGTYRHCRKDGTVMDMEITISSLIFAGRPGRLCSMNDITDRKRIEEALLESRDQLEQRVEERTEELKTAYLRLQEETNEREQAQAQLRQAQKMEALGTLSGGIAHDFNNILAAIIGFTELVESHVDKGSRDAHHLGRVMQAAIRGRELVRQMLTFSRKDEQEKKPLAISSVLDETIKLLRATTPTTISIRISNLAQSAMIYGDHTQIQQVLMNLCTNATHAMRERGGILDISLSELNVPPSNGNPHGINPGLYVKLTVSDTGTGIPRDIIDRIFDPFFTTKKVGEGTGLGLSVVHGIVEQHNGYISLQSEPDIGSVFTIHFPQITGEAETDVVSSDEIPTGSERILFVDDEEALVEMGEDILAELGYEVTSRMSSTEALTLVKEDPSYFDLVITDQTMPNMTGIDLAKEILAIRTDMPIIMCTGFSHLVDADKATASGIRAFTMKPLTKREIARTIRKVIDE
jgi:PAS domain S-box-containing protein